MGQGTIYLMFAQTIFLGAGYVIHVGLGRILGPEKYGLFGVILSLLMVVEIFLIKGVTDAVSKYVSEFPLKANSIKKKGIKIQVVVSLIVFCLYFFSAKYIAILLKDQNLINYIKLSALILPIMSIYSAYIGYLNGKRKFKKQAMSIISNSIGKVFGVFLFVLLGFGIFGAISGYIFGVGIGLVAATCFSIEGSKESNDFPSTKLINFAIPLVIFSGITVLLRNLDLLYVKALIEDSKAAGFYTAAIAFARAPYFLFYALSATLLPSISKSFAENDILLTKKYIRQSLRYLLLILLPLAAIISATSTNLITLFYTTKYVAAGSPLSIVIWGMSFLIMTVILTTIINGIGRPKVSMFIMLPMVPIDIVLNYILIPRYGLQGAAAATTITTLIGVTVAAVYVYREFRVLVNPISFAKIVIASVVIFLIAKSFSTHGIFLIAEYFGLLLLYSGLMFAFREINKEDIEVVKGIFGKAKPLEERIEPF